ncbi:DEAD/DEAH box helicase family protein [Tenacibaculum piscium]|uniref:DEAD/DEAH box helicase family protein n=1 Tax=Tenacibaculum piscium TaxID=1458515 RepID=UPI00187B9C08|nr:DEAD/DEAH box helicase family protein [Tenacibaculum piscium]MBE7689476.1 DEAD/DEAH box helicase family protein [Tenacibaculum piscium]
MLKKVNWAIDRDYKTGSEDEPLQFYLDALCNSTTFDLLLGYFSSSAIKLLSLGFANFIYSGGKMRVVINNVLSEVDKNAIASGQNKDFISTIYNLENIKDLHKSLDENSKHFFECFSWLIHQNKIEIKIIKPKGTNGISHYKSGVFSDGKNSIGYKSSCNFTYYGFIENLEELDCRMSWDDERSNKAIVKQIKYFDEVFSGNSKEVEYLDIEQVKIAIMDEFGNKNIKELLKKEKELLNKRDKIFNNPKIKESVNFALEKIENFEREEDLPKFPYKEGPRNYQKEAYTSWIKNDKKGLFAMATGTGKTLTALNCLLNESKKEMSYKAIILVPTLELVAQWKEECEKFNYSNIISVSSKEIWKEKLSFYNTVSRLNNPSFIVITTYASFVKEKFQSFFKDLSKDTIFIADEVHNIGAPNISKLLPKIHLEKRIGLSATPNRVYDDIGNVSIDSFFNDKAPYVYNFSMKKAIEEEYLCKYYYYPHVVSLIEGEFEKYRAISKKLAQYIDPKTKSFKKCKEVEILLLKRKRIIHKAENKLPLFKKIIQKEFEKRGNLKYTLIYTPEGILEENNSNIQDNYIENEEDIYLIDQYTKAITAIDFSIMARKFTSKTKDRKKVIKKFSDGELDVLTSMKCLDEGVDVPRSELAVFCASTGNPRQFIQRRGRVLRKSEGKQFAYIHDLVVIPKLNLDKNDETYNIERSFILNEMKRVENFFSLAINKAEVYEKLSSICEYYNISLYNINEIDNRK